MTEGALLIQQEKSEMITGLAIASLLVNHDEWRSKSLISVGIEAEKFRHCNEKIGIHFSENVNISGK